MARKTILSLLVVAALTGVAEASDGNFGLGIIVGEPTGVSGKFWLTGTTAIDAAAAWSFSGDNAFELHGDYLLHNMSLIKVDSGKMALYFGLGARMVFTSDNVFGMRVPVGLAYLFAGAPMDVFVEVVPFLNLAPDTDFELGAALGVRYFFGGTTH